MLMILLGIDQLQKNGLSGLKKKAIGLVTNFSFVDSDFKWGIDILFENGLNVKKIFTPEHGLGGVADGAHVSDTLHPKYGVPIVSLYGDKRKPVKEDLDGLDMLVYDIQDVGLRFYTYIYTLAYTMEAAAEYGLQYMVLDRPNPLGRGVFGSRIENDLQTFVGGYELPLQYGLTTGELAQYFKKLKRLDLDLKISMLEGWRGEMHDNTSLFWNVPSPNVPTFESLLGYAGTCFFESTSVSEGRGTFKPFLVIGAPWIDGSDLTKYLREEFPGLRVRSRDYMPFYRKYANANCSGVEFFPRIEDNYFVITLKMMEYLLKYEQFDIMDRSDDLIGIKESALKIRTHNLDYREWKESGMEFIDFVEDCLLYPGELKYRE
jgi:uncharacterized protein YbbC (DUF1343 family)